MVRLTDSFQSFFASTNASLTVLGWFHPLKSLYFWPKRVAVHFMGQRMSYCLHVGLIEVFHPRKTSARCSLIRWGLGLYSLSSAQGWRFCRAYREELWAHSGSDTADSPRDFWRADCCSCMMRRLAC